MQKTSEGARKLWKASEGAENVGRCGKTSEASECVAGERKTSGSFG